MGMFDFLRKKEKREEYISEDYRKDLGREFQLSKQMETSLKMQEFQSQTNPQTSLTTSQQDRISLIESKLENLRIYLEMINSKLDRLETLLRAKGLI